MGYFSNGSEGMDYEARYCVRCVHANGPDGTSGCAVWLAHLLHNYGNTHAPVLNLLIPRTQDGLDNEQCAMFHPTDKAEPEPVRVSEGRGPR